MLSFSAEAIWQIVKQEQYAGYEQYIELPSQLQVILGKEINIKVTKELKINQDCHKIYLKYLHVRIVFLRTFFY